MIIILKKGKKRFCFYYFIFFLNFEHLSDIISNIDDTEESIVIGDFAVKIRKRRHPLDKALRSS